jgi:hypothetical protein
MLKTGSVTKPPIRNVELQADDGDHHQQGVPERVAARDEAPVEALGAGGADDAHHLQQGGAHHAGGDRGIAIAHRRRRPNRDPQVAKGAFPQGHVAHSSPTSRIRGLIIRSQLNRESSARMISMPRQNAGTAYPETAIRRMISVAGRDATERDGDQDGDDCGLRAIWMETATLSAISLLTGSPVHRE